jgi:hypothetical protein
MYDYRIFYPEIAVAERQERARRPVRPGAFDRISRLSADRRPTPKNGRR